MERKDPLEALGLGSGDGVEVASDDIQLWEAVKEKDHQQDRWEQGQANSPPLGDRLATDVRKTDVLRSALAGRIGRQTVRNAV